MCLRVLTRDCDSSVTDGLIAAGAMPAVVQVIRARQTGDSALVALGVAVVIGKHSPDAVDVFA